MSRSVRLRDCPMHRVAGWLLAFLWCLVPGLAVGDFQKVKVQGVIRDPRTAQPVALLADPGGRRTMPIWIGEAEAMALEAALEGAVTRRPLTHDLLASVITRLGASLEEVQVTELKEDVYYALILLKGPEGLIEVDARPSDAMVLAVKVGRPISVESSIFEARSVPMPVSSLEVYGLEVQELDKELRVALSHPGEGVVVSNVIPESPAHKGGIKPGDVIEGIQGKSVASPLELEEALQAAEGRVVADLFRQGRRLRLVIPGPSQR